MRRPSYLLLVASLCLLPLAVFAQSPKGSGKEGIGKDSATNRSAPAPVPATAQRTTASFGDWVLRCENIAAQAKRVCEVAHIVVLKGQTAPLAQLAIGRLAPSQDERLTIVVPPNIAIDAHPQLATAKTGAAPIELSWQRCLPGACFASVPLPKTELDGLAAQTEPGRIIFKNAVNQDVAIPVSFRGLPQALAALAKEK